MNDGFAHKSINTFGTITYAYIASTFFHIQNSTYVKIHLIFNKWVIMHVIRIKMKTKVLRDLKKKLIQGQIIYLINISYDICTRLNSSVCCMLHIMCNIVEPVHISLFYWFVSLISYRILYIYLFLVIYFFNRQTVSLLKLRSARKKRVPIMNP